MIFDTSDTDVKQFYLRPNVLPAFKEFWGSVGWAPAEGGEELCPGTTLVVVAETKVCQLDVALRV